jgi:hypothetical protein
MYNIYIYIYVCVPTFDAELHVQAASNIATQKKNAQQCFQHVIDDAFSP